MARVSDLDVEEDNTVELGLGLSIGGGSLRKRPISISTCPPPGIGSIEEKDPRSVGSAAALILEEKGPNCGDFLDLKSKRELHALRRQEARKKLEEKQQKKRNGNVNSNGTNGILVNNQIGARAGTVDDLAMLEVQELQCRVRDRAVKEAEAGLSERNCKKSGEYGRSDNNADQNPNPNFSVCPSSPFSVVPMQHPFHPVQFLPFANGYQYPYAMPCWATASAPAVLAAVGGGDGLNHEKNVIQPIACRSFRPFQAPVRNLNQGLKQPPFCNSEQKDGSTTESSSSAVSDNQNASLQGGSSGDTRSHSSCSPLEQTQNHVSPIHKAQILTENSGLTHQIESAQAQGAEYTKDKQVLNTAQSNPRKPKETIHVDETISTTKAPPPATQLGVNGKEGEKPKPPSPASLPQMPCVSTTGNGPNGKTITGFLYRYTKSEVSIVCVCHGRFFSPEEFVKHAGGIDVSHPLRHIVVVPSALG